MVTIKKALPQGKTREIVSALTYGIAYCPCAPRRECLTQQLHSRVVVFRGGAWELREGTVMPLPLNGCWRGEAAG